MSMSKNAQFRAIKPSSSILSFVEDNVISLRKHLWDLIYVLSFEIILLTLTSLVIITIII